MLLEQEEEAGVDAKGNPVNICGLTAIFGAKFSSNAGILGIGLKTDTGHSPTLS